MLLEVEDIVQRFGGLVAIDHASFSVEKGEIFGLIGPNGAGKTTMLNVIFGVFRPSGGKVMFRGENITGMAREEICKMGISRTFQVPRKFGKMSVLENVIVATTFGLSGRASGDPAVLAEEALDTVQWARPKEMLANTLNASEMKRLDLARALASKPALLLLDEPASGLTPSEVEELMKLIREIRGRGVTVIIIEHLMRMIMRLVDRMVVLNYGKKIAEGRPEEIAKNPEVIDAYLGEKYLA